MRAAVRSSRRRLPARAVRLLRGHPRARSRTQLDPQTQVRKEGIAHDVEECDVGACCVAAPICDSQGYAVAAISISALSIDRAKNDSDRLERKIRQLASVIST